MRGNMTGMKCPNCGAVIPYAVDSRKAGAKGGKAASGDSKRRCRDHYVAAGKASAAARAAKKQNAQ